MEVELDDALLASRPRNDLTILALCAFGMSGQHRIFPRNRPLWEDWATGFPVALAEEIALVWDDGEERSCLGVVSERVRVVPHGPGQFDQTPLRLTPTEAVCLLGRPLRVFLENGRNDRAFLLAFADVAVHDALRRAEKEGWLVFETAGGITELQLRALDAATHPAPREVFRTMYLCDSDAQEETAISDEAKQVKKSLESLETTYHRPSAHFGTILRRRAAENYAPPDAVLDWAQQTTNGSASKFVTEALDPGQRAALTMDPGAQNSGKRRILAAVALTSLPPLARGYIDMKAGRLRSGKPPEPDVIRTIDAVWNMLDAFQQAALRDGFGARFSSEFYGGRGGLTDETGEVTSFLSKILERL